MAGDSLEVSNAANVSVADDRSPSFRIYGSAGTDAEFTGGSTFTGVFYAPNSNGQQGTISVTSQTEVFGALVGGRTTLQSGGVVHYDQALVRTKTLPNEYTAIPRVTYMHVSVHRVDVESP